MATMTANGERVTRSVKKESDGTWGANVWFGSHYVTDVRRYYYATRKQAQDADIGDGIGKRGRVK